MATFLDLVNQCRLECGVSNRGTPLTTVQGTLSDESASIKKWVADAWKDIQTKHLDWGFMERDFSFNTTASVYTYQATDAAVNLTSFRNWKRDSLRCYDPVIGVADERWLNFQDLQQFRDQYRYATMRTTLQRPVVYTVDTSKRLIFGPVPDQVYTVVGQYYKSAQILSADADVPVIDAEYFDLIVYYAMKKYGYFEVAPEVLQRVSDEGSRLMAQLEADYLPAMTSGPPLA